MLRDPFNLTLACLVTYSLSFAYVFIEVYNTTKFLRPRQERQGKENMIQYAMQVSRRIFAIGLVETLLAVVLASTLLYPAVGLPISRDIIGGITFSQGTGLSDRSAEPRKGFRAIQIPAMICWRGSGTPTSSPRCIGPLD